MGGGRQMGKMDERPTQRHIVTGDVSEDRTWHRTWRLDEGEHEESEVMREARAGREDGENEVEETRRLPLFLSLRTGGCRRSRLRRRKTVYWNMKGIEQT